MSVVDRAVTTRFSARNGRPDKGQDGWSPLSPWAHKRLASRVAYLLEHGAEPTTPVVYGGTHDASTSESPGASAAGAMGELLRLAGLSGEAGIKPGSIGLAFALRSGITTATSASSPVPSATAT